MELDDGSGDDGGVTAEMGIVVIEAKEMMERMKLRKIVCFLFLVTVLTIEARTHKDLVSCKILCYLLFYID